jgi:hypothetical protein
MEAPIWFLDFLGRAFALLADNVTPSGMDSFVLRSGTSISGRPKYYSLDEVDTDVEDGSGGRKVLKVDSGMHDAADSPLHVSSGIRATHYWRFEVDLVLSQVARRIPHLLIQRVDAASGVRVPYHPDISFDCKSPLQPVLTL